MTEKGKVAHVSHANAKTNEQKVTDKATRATEKMHSNVTASLDQLQHSGAAAPTVSHERKNDVRKGAAGAKKAPHSAGSPAKRM